MDISGSDNCKNDFNLTKCKFLVKLCVCISFHSERKQKHIFFSYKVHNVCSKDYFIHNLTIGSKANLKRCNINKSLTKCFIQNKGNNTIMDRSSRTTSTTIICMTRFPFLTFFLVYLKAIIKFVKSDENCKKN